MLMGVMRYDYCTVGDEYHRSSFIGCHRKFLVKVINAIKQGTLAICSSYSSDRQCRSIMKRLCNCHSRTTFAIPLGPYPAPES